MASVTPPAASPAATAGPRSWIERLWSSVADRGRSYAEVLQPEASKMPLDRAREFATALLSERGEASGAAVARELHNALRELRPEGRLAFYRFLSENFLPAENPLRAAAQAYLAEPTAARATQLAEAAEPARQELLRRMNMAPGGTAALVAMRKDLLAHLHGAPSLKPLDSDLRHLFASWFNRGFLELRRIDWQTPAAVLEKLIAYEAVHEIEGWDDLRRRLATDRRCFGFFHPALPGVPLIFVEVALTIGLATSVQPLLARAGDEESERERERTADTAIFYSISNCQDGLRGLSFGNFLIKQVVEELKAELPRLIRFSTLSPVPGFRRWLEKRLAAKGAPDILREDEISAARLVLKAAAEDGGGLLRGLFDVERWWEEGARADALREPLTRLCAVYLTTQAERRGPADPVARFHLGNGARLERVNWLGNVAPRGIEEAYGIMVNYLYDPEQIEANHEAFVRGAIVRSVAVEALLATSARPTAIAQSQSAPHKPRSRKGPNDAIKYRLSQPS
jgi:malonyl-CoA decarboxylase